MIQVQLKLTLKPSQERQLVRWLWHLTSVYNWAIRKIEADANNRIFYNTYTLEQTLIGHSAKMGMPRSAISGTARVAHQAWMRCFRRQTRRPKLKGRRNRLNGIYFPSGKDLQVEASRVRVPVIGRIKFHRQDIPIGRIGAARIVRRASGWYLCLFIQAEPKPIPCVGNAHVGIDPGYNSLLTLSTGEKIEHPHELQRTSARLAQVQRGKRKRLTARLLERQRNQRKDRNHKLSRRLVAECALIAWSKDPITGLAQTFGKSVASASHSQLRQMLSYKCRAGGRQFIEVPSRNSTKTCSTCGELTGPSGRAGLSVRHWVCPCGAEHDRDVNAAVNTLNAGAGIALERARKGASEIAA